MHVKHRFIQFNSQTYTLFKVRCYRQIMRINLKDRIKSKVILIKVKIHVKFYGITAKRKLEYTVKESTDR